MLETTFGEHDSGPRPDLGIDAHTRRRVILLVSICLVTTCLITPFLVTPSTASTANLTANNSTIADVAATGDSHRACAGKGVIQGAICNAIEDTKRSILGGALDVTQDLARTTLEVIHRDYVAETEPDTHAPNGAASEAEAGGDGGGNVMLSGKSGGPGSDLDDEAVLEKAMAAANGSKFERLWNGNTAG